MAIYTRKNAWDANNGGQFKDQKGNYTNLYWYAKGVGIMQSKKLDEPSSWWFFAAIHGISSDWTNIPTPPVVPVTPLPTQNIQDLFWQQCQHQSWYFAPWHRGYLIALEAHIRSAIISLGGPADWALPYWDYFGPGNQNYIPPAFTEKKLPDGSSNPLYVFARFGDGNGNIVVNNQVANQKCQTNTIYTGSNANTNRPGYGGPSTGFNHVEGTSGNLENNPHNFVHGMVGGDDTNGVMGLMSYQDLAALDPIFYLHHCNIDRMWASWNAAGNSNPSSQNWLKGPAANGERAFVMPMPDKTSWTYTPADMNSLTLLNYQYDTLQKIEVPKLTQKLTERLSKLGLPAIDLLLDKNMDLGTNSELVGANQGPLQLVGTNTQTTVKFDNSPLKNMKMSLMEASVKSIPDKVFLLFENVKGNLDANMLTVFVKEQQAGHISLFGLRNASKKDGAHGGGLTFTLDITNIIDNLHLQNALNIDSLDINIIPNKAIANEQKISVGRVSIYREKQQI